MITPNRKRRASVTVRVTEETSESWHAAAAAEGCSLTEWLERAGRARIERQEEVLEALREAQVSVTHPDVVRAAVTQALDAAITRTASPQQDPAIQVDEWQWGE